jgi:hypothetical protein
MRIRLNQVPDSSNKKSKAKKQLFVIFLSIEVTLSLSLFLSLSLALWLPLSLFLKNPVCLSICLYIYLSHSLSSVPLTLSPLPMFLSPHFLSHIPPSIRQFACVSICLFLQYLHTFHTMLQVPCYLCLQAQGFTKFFERLPSRMPCQSEIKC